MPLIGSDRGEKSDWGGLNEVLLRGRRVGGDRSHDGCEVAIGQLNRDCLAGLQIGGRSHNGASFLANDGVAAMKNGLGIEGGELLLEELAVLGRFVETLLGRLDQAPPQPRDRLTLFLELPI